MSLRLTEDQFNQLQARARNSSTAEVRVESSGSQKCGSGTADVKTIKRAKGMNKTETRYQMEKLEPAFYDRKIKSYKFEMMKFRLADNTFYTPDFAVVMPDDRMELHEVKGGWIEEDAMAKFKFAAELFPFFGWKMWQWKDGLWTLLRDL